MYIVYMLSDLNKNVLGYVFHVHSLLKIWIFEPRDLFFLESKDSYDFDL